MSRPQEPPTTYYLEMLEPSALMGKPIPAGFSLEQIQPPEPQVCRDFYVRVGAQWNWSDRLTWPEDRWAEYVRKSGLSTWVAQYQDEQVGYCEWQDDGHGDVQFLYFGLLPDQIGRGIGGAFLTALVEQAWSIEGTCRVWLHTGSNDHPHALRNYEDRGFKVYKTVQY